MSDRLHELVESTRFFSRSEFPPGRLFDHLCPAFFRQVIKWREVCGVSMHPSRWVSPDAARSGFCRFAGSSGSRHYAEGRKADAGDFFPVDSMTAWAHALRMFGGVGLYLDTRRTELQPGPMVHVDDRARPTWWVRDADGYVYHHQEPALFWQMVGLAIEQNGGK